MYLPRPGDAERGSMLVLRRNGAGGVCGTSRGERVGVFWNYAYSEESRYASVNKSPHYVGVFRHLIPHYAELAS